MRVSIWHEVTTRIVFARHDSEIGYGLVELRRIFHLDAV